MVVTSAAVVRRRIVPLDEEMSVLLISTFLTVYVIQNQPQDHRMAPFLIVYYWYSQMISKSSYNSGAPVPPHVLTTVN